jgi:hypothetical protein
MKTHNILMCVALLLPLCVHAQQLQVTSSPGLQLASNGNLQLVFNNGSLVSNGNFSAMGNGTVVFVGSQSTNSSIIGGSGLVSFRNLVLDKAGTGLQLNNSVILTGNLFMSSGNFQLNGYTLDLGHTGQIVGERNASRITGKNGGYVKITADLYAPNAVNPGNIGVEISSQANMGITIITRGHTPQVSATGEESIERWYNISPENNEGLKASLRFLYLDAETGNSNKSTLSFFTRKSNYGTWTLKGKDKSDIKDNWVLKNNLDELNTYTLAKSSTAIVQAEKQHPLQVYPNPYFDHFNLVLFSEDEKDDIVSLFDQAGRVLQVRKVHWNAGVNTIDWIEGKYAAGTYYLSLLKTPGKIIKIVKL